MKGYSGNKMIISAGQNGAGCEAKIHYGSADLSDRRRGGRSGLASFSDGRQAG
jgi:hypothetical protein